MNKFKELSHQVKHFSKTVFISYRHQSCLETVSVCRMLTAVAAVQYDRTQLHQQQAKISTLQYRGVFCNKVVECPRHNQAHHQTNSRGPIRLWQLSWKNCMSICEGAIDPRKHNICRHMSLEYSIPNMPPGTGLAPIPPSTISHVSQKKHVT